MMETKHSPGPWKLSLPDETAVASFDGTEIAAVQGDYDDDDVWPVMAANARLIAAAPELLAACKAALAEVQRTISSHTSFNNTVDVLEAAIAKAEGR
jgi:hypothetical protein